MFTYTGREYEPELGMYYYRARYYDPSKGRFLQTDLDPGKLGMPSAFLSKYVYVSNRPTTINDPSGFSWLSDLFENSQRAIGRLFSKREFQIAAIIVASVFTGGFAVIAAGAVAGGVLYGAGAYNPFGTIGSFFQKQTTEFLTTSLVATILVKIGRANSRPPVAEDH